MHDLSYFTPAESWAASLWNEASLRWAGRGEQDRNYRAHVVHPAVRFILREHLPASGMIKMLDLGCGDGAFLDDSENREMLAGGSYLGVDISPALIGKARERHHGSGIAFLEGNLADRETSRRIVETGVSWDAALSVFVIQEMPDIAPLAEILSRTVRPGGTAVVVTVHPDFAEWLRDTGAMPVAGGPVDVPDGGRWRWAGWYPIVDEPREPFHLPYFYRTVDDYRAAFKSAGFERIEMTGIPDARARADLESRGISPFVPVGANVYWPRIGEAPSALLIAARKEAGV